MNNLELCYMPATEMIRQFKARKTSPLEVMQAIIDRAESTEPVENALSHRFFDTAMNQAKKAQEKYARGKRTRALEGLPVGIKDETLARPIRTRSCSRPPWHSKTRWGSGIPMLKTGLRYNR